jgi:branched-chain amino acid transport system substrate-binding protein
MRILTSFVLVVLLVGVVVGGCAKPAPSAAPAPAPAPPKTLDIGVASPLTGAAANLGTNISNGVLLAIDDQNKEGGVTIAGQKYMLNGVVLDTKFDLVVGKSVAEQLVLDKGVEVIAGPFLFDAVGVQTVTEKNKVIMFAVTPDMPGICGPNKPYSFFTGACALMMMVNGAAYIQKFYPDLKNVMTMTTDSPAAPLGLQAAQVLCPRYGLNWMGYEKFPLTTKDFMPVISRVLAKKPEIIDTGATGGDMGGMCALLIKQLRESGFDGPIWCTTVPPPDVVTEIVPEKFRTRIITNDIIVDSPVVSQEYRDVYQRYISKFGSAPIDIAGEFYDGVKGFFEFLNGQDTMDTTAWVEGFAKYHWPGIWGRDAYWVGKPQFGIDRTTFWSFWVAEYIDGKVETRWEAPIPYDLFVEK